MRQQLKRCLFPLFAVLLFTFSMLLIGTEQLAISGSTETFNLIQLGMPAELATQVDSQYSSSITSSEIPKTNNAIDLGSASKQMRNVYVGSDVVFGSGGAGVKYPAATVMTPSTTFPTPPSTPDTGDVLVQHYNVVATAAPTAAFLELPRATPNIGEDFVVYNQSANPVALVPQSGDTVNLSAAATPFSCATGKLCSCRGFSGTQFVCTGS